MTAYLAFAIVLLAVLGVIRGTDVRLVLGVAAAALGAIAGDPLSVLRSFLDTFSSEKFVLPICSAMGFAYTLRHTECDRHLVRALLAPVRRFGFVLLPGVLVVAFTVNVPVISQTSTAVCVGPVAIPLLRAAGYGPATVAATLCLGASVGGELLNPGAPELLSVSGKTGTDTTTLARQHVPPVLFPYAVVAGLVFWCTARRHSAEGAWGSDTPTVPPDGPIQPLKAVVPVVPLLLLFATGPPFELVPIKTEWLAKTAESLGSRMIAVAMLIGVAVAAAVSPRQAKDVARTFFEGAGYGFTHIVSLIVVASCFAEGLRVCGLAALLGDLIRRVPDSLLPAAAVVPCGFAIVSGSGMASTKGLYDFFHGPATALEVDPDAIGAVVAVGSAAGRTMSPVAAVVLMCGTLTGAKPFDIIKRLAVPLTVGLAVTVGLRMMFR